MSDISVMKAGVHTHYMNGFKFMDHFAKSRFSQDIRQVCSSLQELCLTLSVS